MQIRDEEFQAYRQDYTEVLKFLDQAKAGSRRKMQQHGYKP